MVKEQTQAIWPEVWNSTDDNLLDIIEWTAWVKAICEPLQYIVNDESWDYYGQGEIANSQYIITV